MIGFLRFMHRHSIKCIAIVSVCVIASVLATRAIDTVDIHNDEVSWFFHTQFFEQAFIKHDLQSSFWQSYESYDHPQISKYIYGAYVYGRLPNIFSIRNGLERGYGRWKFYSNPNIESIRMMEFGPYIRMMRELNVVFIVGVSCLIGLIMYSVTANTYMAWVSVIIFLYNPFFLQMMIRATPDAHMIFFTLASLVSYIVYVQRKSMVWLVIAGLCTGFAVSSKLTGFLSFVTVCMGEMLLWGVLPGRRRLPYVTLGMFVGMSMFVWIVGNPALYTRPIDGTYRYVAFRLKQSELLQTAYPGMALVSIPSRFRAVYCTLVEPFCDESIFKATLFPMTVINIASIMAGIYFLMKRLRDPHFTSTILIFILYAGITIYFTTISLMFNSDRYYLPIQISMWLLQLSGVYGVIVWGVSIAKSLIWGVPKTPPDKSSGEF